MLVPSRCLCRRTSASKRLTSAPRRLLFGLVPSFKPENINNVLEKDGASKESPTGWTPPPPPADTEALKKRRRTEWKRRQGGESFLDHIIVQVRGGKGGDGCVAFHREKFVRYGPPSGGNGGSGGDVYILPTPHLTTLSSVSPRIRGKPGGGGGGVWANGKNAPPTIIRVPLGTVVRELARDDPRRAQDEYEAEEEALEGLDPTERKARIRDMRWVHYPNWADENMQRDQFRDAERLLYREDHERRMLRRMKMASPIYMDLDKPEDAEDAIDPNAPLGIRRQEPLGHLVARGGVGGYGNPFFHGPNNRSPKFATRGTEGERVTLSLELKLLADIGLVGMPNAGKSTLLRALTGGRARTEVAGYAFTTLNPVVAVVRVNDDGTFQGSGAGAVYDDTTTEAARELARVEEGVYAHASTRNQKPERAAEQDEWEFEQETAPFESFRFTVADNPGLIEEASSGVGLGHSFLRSIERSPALVYVVDLSAPEPWDELRVLKEELEKYKAGMSSKARMVLANKADLLGGDGSDAAAVEEAKEKLRRLEEFVQSEMAVSVQNADGEVVGKRPLDVVPISAKYTMNLQKVVGLMRAYVEESRKAAQVVPASPPQDDAPPLLADTEELEPATLEIADSEDTKKSDDSNALI